MTRSDGSKIFFAHSHYVTNAGINQPWGRATSYCVNFDIPEPVPGAPDAIIDGPFYPNSKTTVAGVTDGLSNTIFVGEKAMSPKAYEAGVWYWDEPVVMGGTGGTGRCGDGLYPDSRLNDFPELASGPGWSEPPNRSCGGGNCGSPGSAGPQFLFGDGSVRLVKYATPSNVFRNMIKPDDGEIINFE